VDCLLVSNTIPIQMWEKLPFSSGGTALMVFGGAFAGVAAIVGACVHQQKKAGLM
jgi:hypothetical protein